MDCARIDTAPVNEVSVAEVRPSTKLGAPSIVEPVMVTVCDKIDTSPVNEDRVADVRP